MIRALPRAIVVGLAVLIVGGLLRLALPEVLRRVAVDQISRRSGRAVAIEDVDVGVFARWLSLKKVRLAERGGTQTFLELARLDARLAVSALFRSEIRLMDVALVAPSVSLVRTESGQLNVSDLLPDTPVGPSPWTVTVDHLTISNGAVHARDEAVTPPAEWQMRDLQVEAGPLTTRPGAPPGRGVVRARIDEAAVDVIAETLRLDPLTAVAKVAVDGFELSRLGPYRAQTGSPYRFQGGRLAMALTATVDHVGEELVKAVASGTVSLEREAVTRTGEDDPFLNIARVDVTVKEANAITRSLTVESAAIEGAALRARRDARGAFDLADLFSENGPAPATPSAVPLPSVPRRLFPVLLGLGHGLLHIGVERVTLGPSTVTWVDEAVKPTTTLALAGLQATMTDFTWPPKGPATLTLAAKLPGSGTLDIKGPVVPQPFDADLAFHVRNAAIQPYQVYIPGPGQLRGRFNGDSRHRIAQRNGTLLLASRGNGWAEDVEIRTPGASRPALSVERMDLVGIDFDWPRHARVARASFRRPRIEIVREADRSFDVAKLFTGKDVPGAERPAGASPQPAALPRTERRKGLLETMRLDFEEIRIEDGFARFLDRTTHPAFSKDLSQLTVAVNDLGNRPGERARVAAHSIVAGDSTLDVRGELGAIGAPAFLDLVGELGDLPLASFNPYAKPATGWVIQQGDLEYKVRFVLDGAALTATNELVLGQLQVAPAGGADEVKQILGLPLDFIVALAKDRNGEIHATVPVVGSIRDPTFDLRATIRTSIRRAVANLVQAPFRTISRRFQGGDKVEVPQVDSVTFAAGSSVLAPDMEEYLVRVADVLRRSPFVNLALAPAPSLADVEALQAHGLMAPEALLGDLARRRVEATRERLVTVEGIPSDRLEIAEPRPHAAPLPADTAGRVELTVVEGVE